MLVVNLFVCFNHKNVNITQYLNQIYTYEFNDSINNKCINNK